MSTIFKTYFYIKGKIEERMVQRLVFAVFFNSNAVCYN